MTIKQIIVVRKDLNMRKGKLAAQVAHASMKVFLDSSEIVNDQDGLSELQITLNEDMVQWFKGSFTKIVVSVDSEKELLHIFHDAVFTYNLPAAIIKDNGKTEFNGVPTYTAVAIGPANSEILSKLTGHLKLL